MTKTPPTVGQLIYYYRRKSGLTQEAVARHLGVSATTFGSWERGEHPIKDHYYLARIASALHVDPAQLCPEK
jgi:transcriptional regulator with XRE-family HTH domain